MAIIGAGGVGCLLAGMFMQRVDLLLPLSQSQHQHISRKLATIFCLFAEVSIIIVFCCVNRSNLFELFTGDNLRTIQQSGLVVKKLGGQSFTVKNVRAVEVPSEHVDVVSDTGLVLPISTEILFFLRYFYVSKLMILKEQ